MSALLEQHKRLFREFLQNDLHEALLEIKASHPGMRVEDLMQLLRKKRPDLWQEGVAIEDASVVMAERVSAVDEDDARIKRLAGEYKRAHPSWSFDRCWSEARSEEPDLFASD
jgi:hypothetical protein